VQISIVGKNMACRLHSAIGSLFRLIEKYCLLAKSDGGFMKPTALVVEDDAIVAFDISQMLELQGYKVLAITDSGRKAIEIAKTHHPV
jgi:hypothetical protein